MGVYYTIQDKEAIDYLMKKEVLSGKEEKICRYFLDPYKWMAGKLEEKTGTKVDFPIWLWDKKPDIEEIKGNYKEEVYLIELKINDSDVLISDFDAWHCVLNDSPVFLNEKDWDEFLQKDDFIVDKEDSWNLIFDLSSIRGSELFAGVSVNQGVTPQIKLSQIRSIEKI